MGEIVNLVSADTQKLMDFVVYFNAVWLAPIEISLCLFFLWQVRPQCRVFMLRCVLTDRLLDTILIPLWYSATRPFGFGRNRHRHSHFPPQRIHRKEKKQAAGKKLGT